jgi:predicted SnoaL-like aldol condensation-catalyzing enzyme
MTPTPSRAHQNRALVLNAFQRFAAGDIGVLKEVLHEDLVEHSPGNPSGRDAFIEYIASSPVANSTLELRRVIADDEYVVVHYRMSSDVSGNDDAVVDMWRIEDGLIVEHWDVVQPVPPIEDIPNGMF